jgi:hypothetical protein
MIKLIYFPHQDKVKLAENRKNALFSIPDCFVSRGDVKHPSAYDAYFSDFAIRWFGTEKSLSEFLCRILHNISIS